MNKITILKLLGFSISVNGQVDKLSKADSLVQNGNFSKAIELYHQLPVSANIYEQLAKSYVAIGNYNEALINYDSALKFDSTDALLKYDYAKLLSKTKQYKSATTIFKELIKIDQKNPNYHYGLGLVLEQLNDSTDIKSFQSTFDLDNGHQKAIYKLAK